MITRYLSRDDLAIWSVMGGEPRIDLAVGRVFSKDSSLALLSILPPSLANLPQLLT